MKTKAKVFYDDKGNRFIFPMYMYSDDDLIPLETTFWSFSMLLRASTGIEMEKEWLEFDDEAFPHVSGEVGSPGFQHGRATAYFFDGPLFKEILDEQNQQ